MTRPILTGALLAGLGAATTAFALWTHLTPELSREERRAVHDTRALHGVRDREDRYRAGLERRLKVLEARIVVEADERRRLQEKLDDLSTRVVAPSAPSAPIDPVSASGSVPHDSPPPAAAVVANDAPSGPPIDYSKSPMERALAAAGLDEETAADIKRRGDGLVMREMYLRDQATREQWLDTPRFAEEMAAIQAERTSIRDEIGDDAYDRYLFALGQPNRVRVDDVLVQSPAAQAGLQSGDMILRYGEARIFAPEDLVAQTRGGTAGETVRLEVIRNGARLQIEVPRGPLGLRTGATQDLPNAS
jgi:hypothetical protein